MKIKLQYSPLALEDIAGIKTYIAGSLHNKIAAVSTVDGILNTAESLIAFPESGTPLLFDGETDSGYRFIEYRNYVLFYHLYENQILIDRVLYSGRDYMSILMK